MPDKQIEVETGAERYMATVLAEAGKYVVVTHNGVQAIAKRKLGAWCEVHLHDVIARLDWLERANEG